MWMVGGWRTSSGWMETNGGGRGQRNLVVSCMQVSDRVTERASESGSQKSSKSVVSPSVSQRNVPNPRQKETER